ncbi:MAG: phosphate ABC transporter substrate-binding protein [Nitrosomonas sp.]|nr:phosphate ABC transporter substrate-binding protein [Nitrosomonas sp.]
MRFLVILTTFIILLPLQVLADIVVIVNPRSNITALTQHQIIDIYMGRNPGLSGGQKLQPYDQAADSSIRTDFYYGITGKPASAINAYWARLLFTGRASPPKLVADNREMLSIIEKDPMAIGYLDERDLNERVTVVHKIRTQNRE